MKNKEKDDDKKIIVVNRIKKMFKEDYERKSSLHNEWDECYKGYTAELFKRNMPDYKVQEISNYIFATVETVKPIMLANDPKFIVMPQRSDCYAKSILAQYLLDYEWNRTKMFSRTNRIITMSLLFGTAILGLFWDSSSQNGLGNVSPVVIPPFNIFTDSNAIDVDSAEHMTYASYKSVYDVIKSYPQYKEELLNSVGEEGYDYLNFGKEQKEQKKKEILYIETYEKDFSTMEEEIEEEDGKYKVVKLKYPKGRRIVIAGDVLLEDGENPYDHGKFPFVVFKCYENFNSFWGTGEVKFLLSPMEAACQIYNSIIESAMLNSNPVWILDKNSGVEKNSLTNRQGLVIRKNPGTDVKRDAPPALPAYIQNLPEMFKSDIERISGVYDVTRGERPTGITAAAAIEALNEQSQGRIVLKIQFLEEFLGEVGSMWLMLIQQCWDSKRTIRITGKEYTNVDFGVMTNQVNTPSGDIMRFADISKDDVDGDFDVFVTGGSTMPVNKTSKMQQMLQLAQTTAEDGLPMIDRKTMLENAGIDNVDEIIMRFEQIKMQQMLPPQPPLDPALIQGDPNLMQNDQIQPDLSLLSNQMPVQSELGSISDLAQNGAFEDKMAMLIQMMGKMSPKEIAELGDKYPQIGELLDYINSQSNNPTGNSKGEKKIVKK